MRVATAQVFAQNIKLFGEKQANLAKYQNQIGTGKKLDAPEDDPIGAARVIEIESQLSSNDQYSTNATFASARLSQSEAALNSVNDALEKVQELAVQGRGIAGTNSRDRATIARQISEQLKQIVQQANYKDSNGEFLFAGSKSKTEPFALDATGNVTYAGDQGSRQVQISDTRYVQDSDSGFDVFMAVRSGNGTFAVSAADANTGTGVIAPGSVANPAAFVADTYSISFSSPTSYDVTDSAGTVLTSGTYNPGSVIAFGGMQTNITGAPAAGDTFTLTTSPRQSVFSIFNNLVQQFQAPLSSDTDRAKFDNKINQALADLDQSMEKVNAVRATIGVRQSAIDDQRQANEDYTLELTKVRSSLEDVDIVEAATNLSRESTALQAVQQAFAKMHTLTLFNYFS